VRRFVSLLVLLLLLSSVALAHSGSLDANGGHWDHSTGTYHFHDGIHTEGSSGSSGSSSQKAAGYVYSPAGVSNKDPMSTPKELMPMTIGNIFLFIFIGFAAGMVILAVYAHKAREHESQLANDAVLRENQALERGKQIAKSDLQNREQALAQKQKNLAEKEAKFLDEAQKIKDSLPPVEATYQVLIADGALRSLYHRIDSGCIKTGMTVSMQTARELKLRPCDRCKPRVPAGLRVPSFPCYKSGDIIPVEELKNRTSLHR